MMGIREVLAIPFLLYACYSDIKWRRVTNKLWIPMIGLGVPFLIVDFIEKGINSILPALISIVLVFLLVYALYYLGVFGGADAKALISISILIPFYPSLNIFGYHLPFYGLPIHQIFALSVLGNGVLIGVIIPIALFIHNSISSLRERKKPDSIFLSFIGYRKPITELRDAKHLRLLEIHEEKDGSIYKHYRFGGIKIDGELIRQLERYLAAGMIDEKVWVTPGLPFMVTITLGFLVAIIWGDMIDFLVKILIGVM
ncbi:MAG TPA: peptidase A24 [Candidatus Syntrophoarchaeum butanivorans]|uniref:Peptidase A24 n=1 Tax=Candidatus Syntropharchaeum butanivorans TaxID=1839936 RepID=A0A7C0X3Y7_9EURY|nr:peptidase A24 [Candidatus Syntrophoarchaeum butanivorans]